MSLKLRFVCFKVLFSSPRRYLAVKTGLSKYARAKRSTFCLSDKLTDLYRFVRDAL